jgi:hypothetical protein
MLSEPREEGNRKEEGLSFIPTYPFLASANEGGTNEQKNILYVALKRPTPACIKIGRPWNQ